MKILILKPSSLGDVIQAIPVLRLLKLHIPHSAIYWWLSKELLPILDGDPDLTGIFPFDRSRWTRLHFWTDLIRNVRQMRALSFDWVIDLQSLARSGATAWMARGEFLIGLEDSREGARGFYDVAIPRPSFNTHAAEWYLEVLRHLHIPVHGNFDWLPIREETRRAIERKWNPGPGPWLIVNPGARWATKRWPAAYYRELVAQLVKTYPTVKVAILGQNEDKPLGEEIAEDAADRCLNLAGQTSIPEMIEWIRLSQLVVTNDTGPMHVAAAVSKPIISIFGPTEPSRTGPLHQMNGVLRASLRCSPCFKSVCSHTPHMDCMLRLTPDAVFQRVRQRLDETNRIPDVP